LCEVGSFGVLNDCVVCGVRELGKADGSANHRNKPTVGDRPRAPSPPVLPTTPHKYDAEVHQQDEEEDDDDDDDDDDWDEDRFVSVKSFADVPCMELFQLIFVSA